MPVEYLDSSCWTVCCVDVFRCLPPIRTWVHNAKTDIGNRVAHRGFHTIENGLSSMLDHATHRESMGFYVNEMDNVIT